ncbi:MAG: hypothetical protein R3A10_01315 [Caldilineaceae bacterium]
MHKNGLASRNCEEEEPEDTCGRILSWRVNVEMSGMECEFIVNPHAGSDFDMFLEDEGILEEVTARAHKRLRRYSFRMRLPHRT